MGCYKIILVFLKYKSDTGYFRKIIAFYCKSG